MKKYLFMIVVNLMMLFVLTTLLEHVQSHPKAANGLEESTETLVRGPIVSDDTVEAMTMVKVLPTEEINFLAVTVIVVALSAATIACVLLAKKNDLLFLREKKEAFESPYFKKRSVSDL